MLERIREQAENVRQNWDAMPQHSLAVDAETAARVRQSVEIFRENFPDMTDEQIRSAFIMACLKNYLEEGCPGLEKPK